MSKADNTRLHILQVAFDLIYAQGYQLTSVDDIIAQTKVTKGAFYYHFKTKDDMGLAVINEVMYPGMYAVLVKPLSIAEDPVTEIYKMMEQLLLGNPFFKVKYGCPAVNLIEEMASVNKAFNRALASLMREWQETIEKCIDFGKTKGTIRKQVSGKQVSFFISAGYGGVRNMGKLYGESCYHTFLDELKSYLKSLK